MKSFGGFAIFMDKGEKVFLFIHIITTSGTITLCTSKCQHRIIFLCQKNLLNRSCVVHRSTGKAFSQILSPSFNFASTAWKVILLSRELLPVIFFRPYVFLFITAFLQNLLWCAFRWYAFCFFLARSSLEQLGFVGFKFPPKSEDFSTIISSHIFFLSLLSHFLRDSIHT